MFHTRRQSIIGMKLWLLMAVGLLVSCKELEEIQRESSNSLTHSLSVLAGDKVTIELSGLTEDTLSNCSIVTPPVHGFITNFEPELSPFEFEASSTYTGNDSFEVLCEGVTFSHTRITVTVDTRRFDFTGDWVTEGTIRGDRTFSNISCGNDFTCAQGSFSVDQTIDTLDIGARTYTNCTTTSGGFSVPMNNQFAPALSLTITGSTLYEGTTQVGTISPSGLISYNKCPSSGNCIQFSITKAGAITDVVSIFRGACFSITANANID